MKRPTAERVVRDSFSMPADDHSIIREIRDRLLGNRVAATKAEVLRAGLHALKAMDDKAIMRIVEQLEKTKPGRRPRKVPGETG